MIVVRDCLSDGTGVVDNDSDDDDDVEILQRVITMRQRLMKVVAHMQMIIMFVQMVTVYHDSDDDLVCDENEVAGCQDSSACNYDETATDEGSCTYAEDNFDCDGIFQVQHLL